MALRLLRYAFSLVTCKAREFSTKEQKLRLAEFELEE